MSDVVERAKDSLNTYGYAHSYGCDPGYPAVLIRSLLAEVQAWRSMAESAYGVQTPDEAATQAMLTGLSVDVGNGYGEWGCQTLAELFSLFNIQPGWTLKEVGDHAEALANPLSPQRLRAAADTLEALNAAQGFADPTRAATSPHYLRREAERIEGEGI